MRPKELSEVWVTSRLFPAAGIRRFELPDEVIYAMHPEVWLELKSVLASCPDCLLPLDGVSSLPSKASPPLQLDPSDDDDEETALLRAGELGRVLRLIGVAVLTAAKLNILPGG